MSTYPVIILVEPQLGQNIGAVARIMLNLGYHELRIVNPRDGWPNPDALINASGADQVLENAKIYPILEESIADLQLVYATTPRNHDMIKSIERPESAAQRLAPLIKEGTRVGLLFGCERCGLNNDDVALCEGIITISTNPEFSSLNLSHAVSVVIYAFRMALENPLPSHFRTGKTKIATQKDLLSFYAHLEASLDQSGFLRHEKKRPTMIRNIRNIFNRMNLTQQEIQTLRGIIRSLEEGSSK
ncbi:tRNA (cytidine/uridine-2'-O-)-methyltransferase TrmJ [Candidatus Bealeia paramacronuclearis]|uniref:tRNA (cytidine/uridine-2'-O-)-methyltransferase TrmJ n=1 Tax=Candidatus Bealeia paramacronuclearis TaxID=1921001 RepID=A0ABZ2C4B4_9PROT|nr:tRNA (cytidine/uridine-2'-O-)-methyltransferase TrmJ [Candidatus Bealeia paramacronuclearis]